MKKKIIIGILIVAAVAAMVYFNLNKDNEGASAIGRGKVYNVKAATIETQNISSSIIVTGHVNAINSEDVYFDTPLKISEVLVSKGDSVKAGDALMTLDLTSLEKELEQLQVNYEIQELQIERLRSVGSSYDTSSLEIAIELAQLNVDSLQSVYDLQVESYEQNLQLYEEGIISKSELDASEQAINSASSQLETAKLNLTRSETDLASYQSSNATSAEGTAIDIEIQEKNLESLALSIENINQQIVDAGESIICPMDGIITELNINDGSYTSTVQSAMTIVDIDHLKISTDIREYNIGQVKTGQNVIITGDAITEDNIITGTVSYIDPIAETDAIQGTTTVNVEIDIVDGIDFLKPGYTTDCEITTMVCDNTLVGTYEMLKPDKDGSQYVFVIDENNTLVKQYVELGITSDFDVEIVNGLEEGDQVVLNPSIVLEEGVTVEVENENEQIEE